MVAGEDVFEFRADGLVEAVHVGHRDALAVGRVGDEHAGGSGRCLPGREGFALQFDVFRNAGALDVGAGNLDGFGRDVGTVDFEVEGAFGRVVVVEAVEKLLVEVGPALEGESLAVDAGVDVCGDEGGLDEEGARAAHGVDQGALAAPAAAQDDAGGQDFVDGSLGLGHAVAALVERLARRVERENHILAVDVDVDHHVGVLEAHAGALVLAVAVLEPVDDGVLDAVCYESGVLELVGICDGVDREGFIDGEHGRPVEFLCVLIEAVGVAGAKFVERLEDAQCRAALQVCPVKSLEVALKRHHAASRHYIFGSNRAQFLGQHLFQALESLGHHFKFLFHR